MIEMRATFDSMSSKFELFQMDQVCFLELFITLFSFLVKNLFNTRDCHLLV